MANAKLRCLLISVAVVLNALDKSSQADPIFLDTFSTPNVYSSAAPNGNYIVTDENAGTQSTWTAGGGSLAYSRAASDPPAIGNIYNYESSVILTNGTTASTGSSAGLKSFMVSGTIDNAPAANTSQPGLVVAGSVTAGGYLITDYTGANNDFVLLAESGSELVGDEGNGGSAVVVKDFGNPTVGDSYSISLTEDRSGINPSFNVSILDLGPSSSPRAAPTTFFSGAFQDLSDPSEFGGAQIGYRVRDAHDEELSSFGALSLSLVAPEPSSLCLLVLGLLLLHRRGSHPRSRIHQIMS